MPMRTESRWTRWSGGVSPFVDAVAVEAWDAWFRWRDRAELHDLSIDATHARVAHALAAAEPAASAAAFERNLVDACSSWQLLLDERLLASAGTHRAQWPDDAPVAVLNPAMFVRDRLSANARFDHAAFASIAELAVHALDNALALASPCSAGDGTHLRIGLVGLADALAFLGLGYDTAGARGEAYWIAQTLAEGCCRGTIRLACDRGPRRQLADHPRLRSMLDSSPFALRRDAERYGLRHSQLTAITSQQRLALLANNVADAIDPLPGADRACAVGSGEQVRRLHSSGYAITTARALFPDRSLVWTTMETLASVPPRAQMEMREAVQCWIDLPISYPVAQLPQSDPLQELPQAASTCVEKEAEGAAAVAGSRTESEPT
jgi:ribonucleoside-diphosphate reductase alpha chain